MSFLFKPLDTPLIPILNTDLLFPVRRVFCVGRNYEAHAQEMGQTTRQPPFFFHKPADAIVCNPKVLQYPLMTNELHYEVELVVAIDKAFHHLSNTSPWDAVYGYALGIDLTRRDIQALAKQQGKPWDMAKGFDQSAPISSIIRKKEMGALLQGELTLSINDEVKQQANIRDMIWSIPELISELSQWVSIQPGDLIFTGTPSGVGEIVKNDSLKAQFNDLLELEFTIN